MDDAVCRESGNVGEPARPEEEEMTDHRASADPHPPHRNKFGFRFDDPTDHIDSTTTATTSLH